MEIDNITNVRGVLTGSSPRNKRSEIQSGIGIKKKVFGSDLDLTIYRSICAIWLITSYSEDQGIR